MAFWQPQGVRPLFLLPEHWGDERRCRRTFVRIGFTPSHANPGSFTELLHLQRLNIFTLQSEARHIFISAGDKASNGTRHRKCCAPFCGNACHLQVEAQAPLQKNRVAAFACLPACLLACAHRARCLGPIENQVKSASNAYGSCANSYLNNSKIALAQGLVQSTAPRRWRISFPIRCSACASSSVRAAG